MSMLSKYDVIQKKYASIPVDVVAVAKELGLRVWEVDIQSPNNFSGKISKSKEDGGKSGYAIYVNSNHSEARQRFTIAHEIGHYVLHNDLIGDGVQDDALYRSGLPSNIETEANRFAANLLMPMEEVNKAILKHGFYVEQLADLFQVSQAAMAIRLGLHT